MVVFGNSCFLHIGFLLPTLGQKLDPFFKLRFAFVLLPSCSAPLTSDEPHSFKAKRLTHGPLSLGLNFTLYLLSSQPASQALFCLLVLLISGASVGSSACRMTGSSFLPSAVQQQCGTSSVAKVHDSVVWIPKALRMGLKHLFPSLPPHPLRCVFGG